MTLDALIEALEKATGPDRELDDLIWHEANQGHWGLLPWPSDWKVAPAYTASLDAALTLVPEGWHVSHAYWDEDSATFNLTHNNVGSEDMSRRYAGATSPTPALALTLACMKARKP